MAEKPVGLIGVVMPDSFPQAPLSALWQYLIVPPLSERVGDEPFWEFGAACLGIERRFKAAVDHDQAYRALIGEPGRGPSVEEQYIQDREVFNFLVNGLAVLECFGYAAYFLGSFIKPEAFGLVLPDTRRHIDLAKTSNAYEAHFSEEAIAKEIKAVLADDARIASSEILLWWRRCLMSKSYPCP